MANIFDLFKKIENKNNSSTASPITHIIAGLGNTGSEYQLTRHNAGFMAIDKIASKYGVNINRSKFNALTSEAVISGKRVLLMKPQLLMNRSGESIRDAAEFYKIPPENIIVICDDVSFEVGKMRIKRNGSAGGHNGLKNIIYHLVSDQFPRIKLGVGILPKGGDLVGWVLGRIPADKIETFDETACKTVLACELMLEGNIEKAMCEFN